jgi:ribosomal protein S18 acetylase RimI-like enzyme
MTFTLAAFAAQTLQTIPRHSSACAIKCHQLHREAVLHFEWQHVLEDVDWEELSELYRLAPLGDKKPADLKLAFSNSLFKCFVFDAEKLIGAGRALADGVDCSYICDVAVLPAYQGRGVGKAIVSGLVERSKAHKKILLYTAPGKEAFYRQLGFKRMSAAMAIFQNQAQALEWGLVNDT